MSLRAAGCRILLCSALVEPSCPVCNRLAMGGEVRMHVVLVAGLAMDGAIGREQQVSCDLSIGCEISMLFEFADLWRLDVRVFAEDPGGFSIVPIGADGKGNFGVGRRRDVAWGRTRTSMTTIEVRPLRPVREEDDGWPFGVTMREDLPALGRIVIAVARTPMER